MSNPLLSFLPTEVEGVDLLAELALDLRWSWNHAADEVWRQLDPTLWALTHNPWVILQTVSRDRLKRLTADPAFRQRVEALCRAVRRRRRRPGAAGDDAGRTARGGGPRIPVQRARPGGAAGRRLHPPCDP